MIPFKSYLHTQKRKKWKKKTIIPCRQNLLWSIRPFPELIQFFVLGASLSYGKPPKREHITRGETLAKELNLERSDFVFDRQPDAFRSGRAHQWLIMVMG